MSTAQTPNTIQERASKAEKVSEYIRDCLLAGHWSPEERINDLELAETLGVSRSSVREALAQLAEAEIITKVQWKGYYVKKLRMEDIDSIIELRMAVEDIAIRRVVERGNTEDFDGMLEAINLSQSALGSGDQLGYLKADFLFHERLYDASGNPYLSRTISNLTLSISILRRLAMESPGGFRDAAVASIEDHRSILNTLILRDAEKGIELMERHLTEHLKRIKDSLAGIGTASMEVDTAFDMQCRLGESPHWHADKALLLWLDISKGLLYSSVGGRKAAQIVYQGDSIGGITIQGTGDIIAFFNNGTIATMSVEDGIPQPLAIETPENMDSNYFNDAVADPKGRIFVGSIESRTSPGAVYRIDIDGVMTKVISDVPISNGMGFSPDGRFFYHADSVRHRIDRYSYNPETGYLGSKELFYQMEGNIEPDGLTVDSDGRIIVALWNGSSIIFLDPAGNLIRTVALPAQRVTSICFGGENLQELYITSSGGENRSRYGDKAGAVFRLPLEVPGLAEHLSLLNVDRIAETPAVV